MGKFLLGLLWLAGSVYVGYRLAGYSFRFLEEPDFGIIASPSSFFESDAQDIAEKSSATGENPQSWYASLPSATQKCLRSSVDEETFQAALAGEEIHPTPAQSLAIALCLK